MEDPAEFQYFRYDWERRKPDTPPWIFPVQIYYEVNSDDCVPRMIEIFADGRVACEARTDIFVPATGTYIISLVDGSFLEPLERIQLGVPDVYDGGSLTTHRVDAAEFEAVWRQHRKSS